jgi:hypothetical protein
VSDSEEQRAQFAREQAVRRAAAVRARAAALAGDSAARAALTAAWAPIVSYFHQLRIR